jgi:hypothetical protein
MQQPHSLDKYEPLLSATPPSLTSEEASRINQIEMYLWLQYSRMKRQTRKKYQPEEYSCCFSEKLSTQESQTNHFGNPVKAKSQKNGWKRFWTANILVE